MTIASQPPGGSATRWGPLFGARAGDWAETWEGPHGWGTPIYEHVLDRAGVASGTRVLDCGCGAGRFTRMAADRGAIVAGIDAAQALIEIGAKRTPQADFRVGDIEALPWADRSFDVVTGLSAFQFADDKVRALAEARRVARGHVVIVVPSRVAESGIAQVFQPVFPLFDPHALESMRQSGMFALSHPGRLEEALSAAGLRLRDDDELAWQILFEDVDTAVSAFLGAGPTALAIQHAGVTAVVEAVRAALGPFTDAKGRVTMPVWFRAVIAEP